jgi:hypothetical protein
VTGHPVQEAGQVVGELHQVVLQVVRLLFLGMSTDCLADKYQRLREHLCDQLVAVRLGLVVVMIKRFVHPTDHAAPAVPLPDPLVSRIRAKVD